MDKTQLNKIIDKYKNVDIIGDVEFEYIPEYNFEEFANKLLEAINYTRCCKSDSELLCANCLCKPTQKMGFCNECFDSIYSHA